MTKEIIIYRGLEITLYSKPGKYICTTSLLVNDPLNSYVDYATKEEAIESAKKRIDIFLDQKITSFKELTEALNRAICIDSYTEETSIDENVVRILVTKFINERKDFKPESANL